MIDLPTYSKLNVCNVVLMQDGIANTTYKADSSQGEIVARISKDSNRKDPTFEAALIHFLNQRNVRTPTIISDDHGNLYSKDENSSFITVFSFIEGKSLDNSLVTRKEYAFKAGETLANLHIKAKDFPEKNPQRVLSSEIVMGLSEKDSLLKTFPAEAPGFIEHLEKALTIFEQSSPKEYLSILHNDFRPQNIIATPKDSLYIIDFDWATPGPVQKDLALALLEWGRTDDEKEFNIEIIRRFLKGYNNASPFSLTFNQELKDWMFANAMSDATSFILYRLRINKPTSPSKSFMYQKAIDILNMETPYI